jgi:hypothetical protein
MMTIWHNSREARDMARTLDEVIKGLPLDRQQKIKAETARLVDEEMTVRDLRQPNAIKQGSTLWSYLTKPSA